jgi:hypothetical protein
VFPVVKMAEEAGRVLKDFPIESLDLFVPELDELSKGK